MPICKNNLPACKIQPPDLYDLSNASPDLSKTSLRPVNYISRPVKYTSRPVQSRPVKYISRPGNRPKLVKLNRMDCSHRAGKTRRLVVQTFFRPRIGGHFRRSAGQVHRRASSRKWSVQEPPRAHSHRLRAVLAPHRRGRDGNYAVDRMGCRPLIPLCGGCLVLPATGERRRMARQRRLPVERPRARARQAKEKAPIGTTLIPQTVFARRLRD